MNYHIKDINTVLKELKTSNTGITNEAAEMRILKYGSNEIPSTKQKSVFSIFVGEFFDPIILILIVAIIFSIIIGEYIDACVIIAIILIDALMGTFQEYRASKNAQALSSMIKVYVKVLRDNEQIIIDSADLALGDIIFLESGDKISADARIIECNNLKIDESALTGESLTVEKNNQIIEDCQLADRLNMLYAGTNVITGRCKAVVTAVGLNTEIGKIAAKVNETKEEKTPLTIRMNKFSKQISIIIIAIAIIIALILYLKGADMNSIFLSVIALSVSAMPEGLPLALTMALSITSNRMMKKNVIVKKLNSVESLGSCTVIASDKTGTLTLNEQTAKKIVLPNDEIYDISGTGYNDEGKVSPNFNNNYIFNNIMLNNEANIVKKNNKFEYYGDSIDIAFKFLGMKIALPVTDEVIAIVPYESEKQYSMVITNDRCYIKGSLEKVMSFCNTMSNGIEIDKNKLQKQNEELAREGFRVIALAHKDDNSKKLKKFNFDGLVAFIDPERNDVKESLQKTKEAGIKVVMITGDHPLTAFAIAKKLSIATNENEIATSKDLEMALDLGQEYFDNYIKSKLVFSRVTPIQKLEIVNSYKRMGEFVAVTGDGVNDAPALKAANIGIAMGSGTDVSKESASMIITNDLFSSIVAGIEEGRCAYNNIRKISYFLLSCGLAEVLFFLLSIILNLPIPLIAIQLLWLNVVTDGLQDISLSFEKIEPGVMKSAPRNTKEPLFDKLLTKEIITSGIFIGVIIFIIWYLLIKKLSFDITLARTYIMALMVFMQNIHVLNCRSEKTSIFKMNFFKNPFIIITIIGSILLQIIVMEVPFFNTILKVVGIKFGNMILLLLIACLIIPVMEMFKKIKK